METLLIFVLLYEMCSLLAFKILSLSLYFNNLITMLLLGCFLVLFWLEFDELLLSVFCSFHQIWNILVNFLRCFPLYVSPITCILDHLIFVIESIIFIPWELCLAFYCSMLHSDLIISNVIFSNLPIFFFFFFLQCQMFPSTKFLFQNLCFSGLEVQWEFYSSPHYALIFL